MWKDKNYGEAIFTDRGYMSSLATNELLKERADAARTEYPRLIERLVDQAVAALKARHGDYDVTDADRQDIRDDIEDMVKRATH